MAGAEDFPPFSFCAASISCLFLSASSIAFFFSRASASFFAASSFFSCSSSALFCCTSFFSCSSLPLLGWILLWCCASFLHLHPGRDHLAAADLHHGPHHCGDRLATCRLCSAQHP